MALDGGVVVREGAPQVSFKGLQAPPFLWRPNRWYSWKFAPNPDRDARAPIPPDEHFPVGVACRLQGRPKHEEVHLVLHRVVGLVWWNRESQSLEVPPELPRNSQGLLPERVCTQVS